jgi:hypothetical protein
LQVRKPKTIDALFSNLLGGFAAKPELELDLCCFLCGTGALTQDFTLAKQVLCYLNHTFSPRLFWGWILSNSLPRLALNHDPPNFSHSSS